MIETKRIFHFFLIRDVANPLARQVRQATCILVGLFSYDGQTNIAVVVEETKVGVETELIFRINRYFQCPTNSPIGATQNLRYAI